MNVSVTPLHDHKVAGHGHHHDHAHEHETHSVYGFWLYLMSDCVIFSCLFAMFGVLSSNFAGGPSGKQLFDLPYVFGETMLLLVSSFTFGMAMLNMHANKKAGVVLWLVISGLLGAGFVGMEVHEFINLIKDGAGPDRSAFLSAYFTLVGTHGLHVTVGILWLATMVHQVMTFGLTGAVRRRLACLSLFWHFLDLIWICVFTFVYLHGVL